MIKYLINKTLIITITLVTCNVLVAQTKSSQVTPKLVTGNASDFGMSNERLARIDSMCLHAIQDGNIPGAVALVVRNNKVVYHKAFGTSNAETNQKVKKDDIFRFASQSKAITATAVMMLWEQGKFKLDDPISKYIPEFKEPKLLDSLFEDGHYTTKPASGEITIRHLLTHTSGLGYGEIDGDERFKTIYRDAGIVDLFTTEDVRISDNIKKLAKLPLHHNPGEKFTYAEGYDVLGYFIEIISKMPFDVYLKKHIFEPLEMNDTYFYLPESKVDRLVAVQTKKDGKWINYPITIYDTDYPIKGKKTFFSGGAGLCGTALDYAKFLQMYLNKGEYNGVRLLSRTTVDVIMANQVNELFGRNGFADHGLAFMMQRQKGEDYGGYCSNGCFSWGGYFNTAYIADPEEQLIGVILKQTQNLEYDPTEWKFPLLIGQAIDD